MCLQNDVEIPIPKYFVNERAKNLKEREKLLGQILAKIGPQDQERVSAVSLCLKLAQINSVDNRSKFTISSKRK